MQRKNNSAPGVCVSNLLRIARGEVPYERIKGISSAHIGTPSSHAVDEVVEDAGWMLGTYEPRAEIESIKATPTDAPSGHFDITATIKSIKEAEEWATSS